MTNFYDVLEITKNATEEEIKKAYRRLSLLYHPDRNPTPEANTKMQEINTAYQTLSNKELKRQYDMQINGFGGNGIDMFSFSNEMGGGMGGGTHFFHREFSMNDMDFGGDEFQNFFSMMFNGDLRNAQNHVFKQLNKPPPVIKNLNITMKQSYTGGKFPVEIEKTNMSNNGVRETKKETVTVNIPPGIKNGEVIILREYGNTLNYDQIKGDIKIIINVVNNTIFERNGMDLILKKKLTLKEALCGFSFDFTHLNDSHYTIKNNSSIVVPNQKQIIPNLGMKNDDNYGNIGDLIIIFEIEFPTTLDSSKIDILREIL